MPTNSLFGAVTVVIRGSEKTQRALADMQAQLEPGRGMRSTMSLVVGMLHRYAASIVHVDSGRLKNSLFWGIGIQGDRVIGQVGTNVSYSIYEHARNGSHAFFARTIREQGPAVNSLFAENIRWQNG